MDGSCIGLEIWKDYTATELFFFSIVWAEVFLKQRTISFGLFSSFWAEVYNRPTCPPLLSLAIYITHILALIDRLLYIHIDIQSF